MELEDLRSLKKADQQVFLLGRITAEATTLDAALRLLNGTLQGREDEEAASFEAPDFFRQNIKQCKKLTQKHHGLDIRTREAVLAALDFADDIYGKRNRFIHDYLRASWELVRLSDPGKASAPVIVSSFDDMAATVTDLTAARWRLFACSRFIRDGRFSGMTFGYVEGDWDGGASYYG